VGVGGPAVDGASPVTLGAAFLGDAFTVEYAWRGVDAADGAVGDSRVVGGTGGRGIHGVSVRFR